MNTKLKEELETLILQIGLEARPMVSRYPLGQLNKRVWQWIENHFDEFNHDQEILVNTILSTKSLSNDYINKSKYEKK